MTIETYPEMNDSIVGVLRWNKDNPMLLYAAQRIEELVAEVERLQRELELHKELYVFSENDMGMMKAQRDGARDSCASYRSKIKELACELRDERIRRSEWEKMYNQAVANDTYWKQYYEESQAMRIRLMRESRIRKVCLEIAMETLRHYVSLTVHAAQKTIDKIEARLTELEPGPAPDALPCRDEGGDCGNLGSVALFGDDPATGNALCWACDGYKAEEERRRDEH